MTDRELASAIDNPMVLPDGRVESCGNFHGAPVALAAPAAVDSLPTSAMQEDHVSMGWGAARKLRRVLDNLRRILAVEWSPPLAASSCEHPCSPRRAPPQPSACCAGECPALGLTAGCPPSWRQPSGCSPTRL